MKVLGVIKLILGVGLLTNGLTQLISHETWWFMQNVNLIFHEAGHVLFMFFGKFLYILGGSLSEILIPTLITVYFWYHQQTFSAACTSWWMATAFLSVSIYAADAYERHLPLITGDIETHDWFNLLQPYGFLKYDNLFGYTFWLAGLLSLGLLVYFLYKDKEIRLLFIGSRPEPT